MAKKSTLKEIYYLKADNNHYKVIEVCQSKNVEIRLTDKVERFEIVNSTLENYKEIYKLVLRKEITDYVLANKLQYLLPVIQLSMNLSQGKLF